MRHTHSPTPIRAATDPHCTATVCPENHTATNSFCQCTAGHELPQQGGRKDKVITREAENREQVVQADAPARETKTPARGRGQSRMALSFLLLSSTRCSDATSPRSQSSGCGLFQLAPATPDVSFIGLLNQCALQVGGQCVWRAVGIVRNRSVTLSKIRWAAYTHKPQFCRPAVFSSTLCGGSTSQPRLLMSHGA